jgi:hypothetical protein
MLEDNAAQKLRNYNTADLDAQDRKKDLHCGNLILQ